MTRSEILRKIARIEQQQYDVNKFINYLKEREGYNYDYLIEANKLCDPRFEDCKEDKALVNLLDEEQLIIQNLQKMNSYMNSMKHNVVTSMNVNLK